MPGNPDTFLPGFLDRATELAALEAWGHNPAAGVLEIHGGFGTGKTALAYAYAARTSIWFRQIVWIDCHQLATPEALVPYALSQMGDSAEPPLLIVLNGTDEVSWQASEWHEVIGTLVMKSPDAHILLTGRERVIDDHLAAGRVRSLSLELGPLTPAEVADFWRTWTGSDDFAKLLERLEKERAIPNTPRLLKRMLNEFVVRGATDSNTIEDVLADLLGQASGLLIIPSDDGRLAAVPVEALDEATVVTPSDRLLDATPFVLRGRARRYWRRELEEFEAYLNDPSTPEHVYQQFFTRNPRLLGGLSYDRVVPHPVLSRRDNPQADEGRGPLIPDFMLVPHDDAYAEILDPKLPTETLVVGRPDRLHYSSSVSDALAQVREYRSYFEVPSNRQRIQERYGLIAYRPSVTVVIGHKAHQADALQLRRLADELPRHVTITTYEELLARMRRLVRDFEM